MNIVLFTPLGSISQESGLIYLVASYLKAHGHNLTQLICDGAVSNCIRDEENKWNRELKSCFQCMAEQRGLSHTLDIEQRGISSFLSVSEVRASAQKILSSSVKDLLELDLGPIKLGQLATYTIERRFGAINSSLMAGVNSEWIKQILLSSMRSYMALGRACETIKPELSLVAGGKEFLSFSMLQSFRQHQAKVANFEWNLPARVVQVSHPENGQIYPSEFILNDNRSFRPDLKSWPAELVDIAEGIVNFLDIPIEPMPLFANV